MIHSDEEELDEEAMSRIHFRDPLSGQMSDMWLSYKHMFNHKCVMSAAMLFRPKLSKNDLYDLIDFPEHVQLFQHKDWAACLSRLRRYKVSQRAVSNARGLIWRKIRDRLVPPPRVD